MNYSAEENEAFQKIKKAPIMIKFQLYGFFKNLQFFEPFILLIFLAWNFSLFQIGLLMLVQEIFTYLFEIPSGILADKVIGKKNELLICFVFYMVSFLFYFLGPNLFFVILGASFYGLGESFRSGTHKAMELQWMEKNNFLEYKSYVYGRTRSWSLYGSALNSILAIIFVLIIPADEFIFLLAIIPFLLDFVLIATYPKYMNDVIKAKKQTYTQKMKQEFKDLWYILKNNKLRKGIITSSVFDAVFKTLKDYIQPIMKFLIGALIIQFTLDSSNEDNYVKLVLGIVYAIFYFLSSFSSKNAYKVTKRLKNTKRAIDILFDLFAVLMLLEALFIWLEIPIIIIFIYLLFYIIYNLRRPMLVGYIGELAPKNERATVLSVESQIKALIMFIMAPLFGFIADAFSIQTLFIIIGIGILIINSLFLRGECKASDTHCDDEIDVSKNPKNIEEPKKITE